MAINYVSAQANTVTSLTTVYNPTTSGVQATLTGCLLCNLTNSPVNATVTLTNASATVVTNIAYNIGIPPGNSLDVVQAAKIIVVQNAAIKVSATGAVDVTLSSIEVS